MRAVQNTIALTMALAVVVLVVYVIASGDYSSTASFE
jgi:hypothetical protein